MEDELIGRAQQGDEGAFQELVERYSGLAWRTARVLLSDQGSAEDAVQEAWLDAWRGLRSFQSGRTFRPWLLKIVSNRCRMVARRRTPPNQPLDELLAGTLAAPEDAAIAAIETENTRTLAGTLAGLPAEQRRVLALRFFADLELSEIATVTNVPLGTVKSRLHRGLGLLRTQRVQPQPEFQATREGK